MAALMVQRPFAGIGDLAGKLGESWVLDQRGGGEIQQPGGDDAAAAPALRRRQAELRSY